MGKVTEEIRRPTSVTEDIYMIVEDAYRNHGGNVSAIERELRKTGIKYSRRKISKILDKIDLPRIKKTRK
jgi:transposase